MALLFIPKSENWIWMIFCGQFKSNVTNLQFTSDVVQYIFDSSVASIKTSWLSSTLDPKSLIAHWLLNQSFHVQDRK